MDVDKPPVGLKKKINCASLSPICSYEICSLIFFQCVYCILNVLQYLAYGKSWPFKIRKKEREKTSFKSFSLSKCFKAGRVRWRRGMGNDPCYLPICVLSYDWQCFKANDKNRYSIFSVTPLTLPTLTKSF